MHSSSQSEALIEGHLEKQMTSAIPGPGMPEKSPGVRMGRPPKEVLGWPKELGGGPLLILAQIDMLNLFDTVLSI